MSKLTHYLDFRLVARLTNQYYIGPVAFSPQSDEITISTSHSVESWSIADWRRTRQLNFIGLVYSPDGRTVWLTKDYRNSGLYDARTLELLLPLPEGTRPLAVSRDGRFLAVSVDSRRLQVWDLDKAKGSLRELGLQWNSDQPR